MKLPVEDSVFVIVLPNDLEHGKSILDWALQNVAKDAERLVIIHVHEQTSPNELKTKLGEYVAMYGERKVKYVQLNEDDDVVKGLRNHIELKAITNLVVGVEADELHSEIKKSLNYEMQTEAPPCMIWFIACDGTLTGHLERSIDDSWITRILQMSRNNHRLSSPHKLEINTSANADIPDCFTSVLEMVSRLKKENKCKLDDVNSKESRRKKMLMKMKDLIATTASSRRLRRLRDKEKGYIRDLEDAKKGKLNLRKEGKKIEEMESLIEFLVQKREKTVTEAGQDEKNDLQTTLELLADWDVQLRKEAHERPTMHQDSKPSITSAIEMVKRTKNEYQRKLYEVTLKKSDLNSNHKNLVDQIKKRKFPSEQLLNQAEEEKKKCADALVNAEEEEKRFKKQLEEVDREIISLEEIARNECCIQQEPEAAVTEADEKNDQQSAMTLPAETVNTEFSEAEIEESINKCLGKTKTHTPIGTGRSGSVYKGCLRDTVVAIKKLHRESVQDQSDFIQKAAVLGRVRHPNLVTLIGVSREVFSLVYEFVPNGSLQDQLVACRHGISSALNKWQVRMRIIREIWMVLTFLHSSNPPLVHGNLKASKVLLDSNYTCKLEAPAGIISQANGTPTTTENDVHLFGIIALQLLLMWLSSEKDAVKVVDEANKKGELDLDILLKTTAWDWPRNLAKRLVQIGLRCVGMMSPPRDDLAEELRQLFDAADCFAAASQEQAEAQAPDHFRCPVSGLLMVDPHIATDGHTYEGKSLNTWFFSYGKDTSPVTRETIADKKLILNRTVKCMIEDWKKEQQRQVRTTLTICDLQDHPTIPPAAQSQPPTGLHPDPVTSRSLTPLDTSAEAQLQLQPPPASSSPPTTLISSTADARSRSTAPLNTSAASAGSHRLNPLPANPSTAAPPPPRPVSPSSAFLPAPTGIRRRHVNGRLPSSSSMEADVPGPGESSRIRGKFKHE